MLKAPALLCKKHSQSKPPPRCTSAAKQGSRPLVTERIFLVERPETARARRRLACFTIDPLVQATITVREQQSFATLAPADDIQPDRQYEVRVELMMPAKTSAPGTTSVPMPSLSTATEPSALASRRCVAFRLDSTGCCAPVIEWGLHGMVVVAPWAFAGAEPFFEFWIQACVALLWSLGVAYRAGAGQVALACPLTLGLLGLLAFSAASD